MRAELKKCVLCNENDYELSDDDLDGDDLNNFDKGGSLSSSFFYRLQMQNIDMDLFQFKNAFGKKRNQPAMSISESENQSLNASCGHTAVMMHELDKFKKLKTVKSMPNGNKYTRKKPSRCDSSF